MTIISPSVSKNPLKEMEQPSKSIRESEIQYFLWNAKVGNQDIPGATGKFGLEVQNEVGQRLTEFCQENARVKANTFFQQHNRRLYTWTSLDGQY